MLKFLNTKDNLSIEEHDSWKTIEMNFDLKWLDLSLKDCYDAMLNMFQPIESTEPVCYVINFNGNEEELDWVLEDLIELGIEKIVPKDKTKFEELRPQPRFEIAERIAASLLSQKRLINYESITQIFTIQIKVGNEIVYDLMKEN